MKSNVSIGALGGSSFVVSDMEIPSWFAANSGNYAVGYQSSESNLTCVSQRGYLWGAGLIVRASILRKCFNSKVEFQLTGRKGNSLLSGDDSEMCAWILLAGYELFYTKDLVFGHYMPQSRLTLNYLYKMKNGHRKSYKYISFYWFLLGIGPFAIQPPFFVTFSKLKVYVYILLNPISFFRVYQNCWKIRRLNKG